MVPRFMRGYGSVFKSNKKLGSGVKKEREKKKKIEPYLPGPYHPPTRPGTHDGGGRNRILSILSLPQARPDRRPGQKPIRLSLAFPGQFWYNNHRGNPSPDNQPESTMQHKPRPRIEQPRSTTRGNPEFSPLATLPILDDDWLESPREIVTDYLRLQTARVWERAE